MATPARAVLQAEVGEVLVKADELQRRVAELGEEISRLVHQLLGFPAHEPGRSPPEQIIHRPAPGEVSSRPPLDEAVDRTLDLA